MKHIDYLRKEVSARLDSDYQKYLKDLASKSPEDIIRSSYETTIKEEITMMFTPTTYGYGSEEELEALLLEDDPLQRLYDAYLQADGGISEVVEPSLFDELDKLENIREDHYQAALGYYAKEVGTEIENEYVKSHKNELIYCYRNDKNILDFDEWTHLEDLLDEPVSYEDYQDVSEGYTSLLDIEENDREAIAELRRKFYETEVFTRGVVIDYQEVSTDFTIKDFGKIMQDMYEVADKSENNTWFLEREDFETGKYTKEDYQQFCEDCKRLEAKLPGIDVTTFIERFDTLEEADNNPNESMATFYGDFYKLFYQQELASRYSKIPLPDPTIRTQDMKDYGYAWTGMLPLGTEAAKHYFNHSDLEIFRLYEDNTETLINSFEEIEKHAKSGGLFGIERDRYVETYEKEQKNETKRIDFLDDKEKMTDFYILSKKEFLNSYRYLTEAEYDATMRQVQSKKDMNSQEIHMEENLDELEK